MSVRAALDIIAQTVDVKGADYQADDDPWGSLRANGAPFDLTAMEA